MDERMIRDVRHAVASGTSSRDLVDDAVQDAFVRRYSRPRTFDDRGHETAWLIVVARRELWRRAGRPELRLMEDVAQDVPAPDVLGGIDARLALLELKPHEAIALAEQAAGFKRSETAARHGWTVTKVNRCLSEGRMALRASTDKGDNDDGR